MRRPHLLLTALVATGLLAAPAGASAPSGAPPPLTLDDVGRGTCTPDPVHPGSTTDCSFALARPAPLDPDGGPYRLAIDRATSRQLPHCHVEGDRLRCPDLPVHTSGPDGGRTQAVTLMFGEQRRDEAVVVDVAEPSRQVRLRIADTTVVTPTVPLRYATADLDRVEGAWLRVTPRYDDEVLTTIELEATGGWDADPAAVPAEVLGVAAGSYRLHLCVGTSAATCDATGRSSALQVVDQPLEPLLDDGQADPAADRINLVVAGYGFDDHETFTDLATTALGPDGLAFTDAGGTRLDRQEAEQVARTGERVDLHFGLFGIEPFDEHRDRFNLWVLPTQLDDPWALHHDGEGDAPPWIEGLAVDDRELANVSVVTLAQDPPGADPGSRAAPNDLHEVEGPVERGDDGEVGFSGSTTWVDADAPWRDVTTVVHELGHTLFGLRDEYQDPASPYPHYGYPNCAESREQAERWWGDQVGDLDPMAERYRQLLETYQPGMRDISDEMLAEWVGVGIHEKPCGAAHDAPASFVPTERGLMAHELPILGSVNRARVEQVLGLFSGQPVTDGETREPTDDEDGAPDPTPTPTRPEATTTEAAPAPGRSDGGGRSWLVALLVSAGVGVAATWAWRRRGAAPRGA